MTDQPKLPMPLPCDVNISDLPYIQLHDTRLMKSRAWLQAKNWRGGGPGLGFCLMNLWVAAFRSVPAGSLDDDDDMLADAARCDIDFWLLAKEKALRGWEQHGGRLWHPVVAELAWEVWLGRLNAKHLKAIESHRAAAKRAMDKGNEPSDPPGGLYEWMAVKYPNSFAYLGALSASETGAPSQVRTPDIRENTPDIEPKRSEDKGLTPLTPQPRPADGAESGREGPKPGEGKRWFAQELTRLENEFRPMLPTMMTYLQRPGASAKFGLVQSFKGCWLGRNSSTERPELLTPTKARADKIVAEHGEWLRSYYPELIIRHAKVDELRARKAA